MRFEKQAIIFKFIIKCLMILFHVLQFLIEFTKSGRKDYPLQKSYSNFTARLFLVWVFFFSPGPILILLRIFLPTNSQSIPIK